LILAREPTNVTVSGVKQGGKGPVVRAWRLPTHRKLDPELFTSDLGRPQAIGLCPAIPILAMLKV
jgi:hypothetical protein